MRITDLSTYSTMTRHVQQGRDALSLQQERLASGRKVLRVSEAPDDFARAATAGKQLVDIGSWLGNIRDTQAWEQHTEAALDQMIDTAQRLHELTISALDGTKTGSDRRNLADEVDQLLEHLVATANREVDSAHLFSGMQTDTPPLAVSRLDGRIIQVQYQGGDAPRQVTIAPTIQVDAGAAMSGSNGLFANPGSGYDLLAGIIGMRDALAAGDKPASEVVQDLDAGLDALAGGLVRSGINQQRLAAAGEQLGRTELQLQEKVDGLMALDMSAAVIELNRLQVTFQASLQMAANLQKISLMQFL